MMKAKDGSLFASAYFALIPVFAVFYWTLPEHFYHATTSNEPRYFALVHEVESGLAAELKSKINKRNEFSNEITARLPPDPEDAGLNKHRYSASAYSANVQILSVEGNDLRISISYRGVMDGGDLSLGLRNYVLRIHDIGWKCGEGPRWSRISEFSGYTGCGKALSNRYLNFLLQSYYLSIESARGTGSNFDDDIEFKHFTDPGWTDLRNQERESPSSPEWRDGDFGYLISSEVAKYARSLFSLHYGKLDAESSSFIRMLYFSAVTITTLGYGDIVPLTNVSRLLVGIESVLGVVLIGLFLNALANRVRVAE